MCHYISLPHCAYINALRVKLIHFEDSRLVELKYGSLIVYIVNCNSHYNYILLHFYCHMPFYHNNKYYRLKYFFLFTINIVCFSYIYSSIDSIKVLLLFCEELRSFLKNRETPPSVYS